MLGSKCMKGTCAASDTRALPSPLDGSNWKRFWPSRGSAASKLVGGTYTCPPPLQRGLGNCWDAAALSYMEWVPLARSSTGVKQAP